MPGLEPQSDAPHDLSARSALIKSQARELGLHKIGIVRAQALSSEGGRLSEWLGRGFHGEMKWIARDPEQRVTPQEIFPGGRSVVVAALNYYTAHDDSANRNQGSRYTCSD